MSIDTPSGLIMKQKLLHWLFAALALFTLVHGCQSMVVEMTADEVLYRAKCSSCHNVIEPGCYGKERWRLYIDKYGQKLTVEEKQILLQYLADTH